MQQLPNSAITKGKEMSFKTVTELVAALENGKIIEDIGGEKFRVLKGAGLQNKCNGEWLPTEYDFFMDDLESWIYDNLEIDIVLDRITEVGMDSLKDVEKNFLKNYNNEQD